MHRTLVAVLCAAACVSAASAQSIINGDFSLTVPSNSTGNGWTSSHIDGAGGWRSSGGNPGGTFIMNDNGDPSSDPTLAQVITDLVVGEQYTISGQYASAIIAGSGQNGFLAMMDGVTIFTGTAGVRGDWRDFAGVFTATSTSMTLELHAEALGTDVDFMVDNIAISAVPAPGPMALLSLGLIVGTHRRRR